jgi:hypothetical protein
MKLVHLSYLVGGVFLPPLFQIGLGAKERTRPNKYPLNRIFLRTHPRIYIMKSHRTGEEKSLAESAV